MGAREVYQRAKGKMNQPNRPPMAGSSLQPNSLPAADLDVFVGKSVQDSIRNVDVSVGCLASQPAGRHFRWVLSYRACPQRSALPATPLSHWCSG